MKTLMILLALTLTVTVNAQSSKSTRAQKKAEVRMQRQLASQKLDWHTAQDLKWAAAEMAKTNVKNTDVRLIPIDQFCSGIENDLAVADVRSSHSIMSNGNKGVEGPLTATSRKVTRGKY